MIPVILTKALTAADDDNISLSQTPLAGGNLTITGAAASGGVATLDTERRVIVTSAGNESARTFTIYGTTFSGQATSEAVTGANVGIVATNTNFLTVTRVAVDAATAGAVKVGTNTTGSTRWINPSWHVAPFSLELDASVSGTVTYQLEYTLSDYYTPTPGTGAPPSGVVVRSTAVAGATGNSSLALAAPIRGWRVTVTSGTGTVTVESIQAGIGSEG